MATIGKYNKVEFSETDTQFLKDNFYKLNNRELSEALGLRPTTVRTYCYSLGLYHMRLQYWTEQQVQFLIDNYKEIGDTELAEIFDVKWHKAKGWTKKHIEKKRRYLKLKRTEAEKKAIKERNRQLGYWRTENNHSTISQAQIGKTNIRYNKNGVPTVVIKTKQGFVHYNPWLWEQHYGKPPKGMVVRNTTTKLLDVTIEDLILITRQEHAALNSKNRLPKHLLQTRKLINRLQEAIQNTENYDTTTKRSA